MIGWVAILTGAAGVLATLFLLLFFIMGQPFGTINDILIGVTAVLSVLLAWHFFQHSLPQVSLLHWVALLAALVGAASVVSGSVLVISGRRGWYLSGLYMAAGFGMIGLWLVLTSWHGGTGLQGLTGSLGMITGCFMLLGLLTVPGILRGIEAWEAAPWYVNYIGLAGSIGWLILYPGWCAWVGWLLLVS